VTCNVFTAFLKGQIQYFYVFQRHLIMINSRFRKEKMNFVSVLWGQTQPFVMLKRHFLTKR